MQVLNKAISSKILPFINWHKNYLSHYKNDRKVLGYLPKSGCFLIGLKLNRVIKKAYETN